MLDREACERRVYRLATLLTGNPNAAVRVIAQVVDAQPDLRHLDSAHMDRLTVLRSREISPATIVHEQVPPQVASALAALTAQQREAWIFSRVYDLHEREMSRAMDCSVTATQRHLAQADEAMIAAAGSHASQAPAMLRAYTMSVDVPVFYRSERLRKRRLRLFLKLAGALILAVALAALALRWAQPMFTP